MKRNLMIIRILAFIAIALSSYILWTTLNERAVLAGCGEGSGCETVLQTKWSSWFGLPVSGAALIVYGSIFVLTFSAWNENSKAWIGLIFLTLMASASGFWFMIVQSFLIKSYCIYCTIIHFCGILIAIFTLKSVPIQKEQTGKKKKEIQTGIPARKLFYAGLLGALSVSVLAVGQMKSTSAVTGGIRQPGSSFSSSISEKTVGLMNGMVSIHAGRFPILGNLDAKRIVAHLFDYTCPACRQLHKSLIGTLQANQQNTALCMIPVPLDQVCNPGIDQTAYVHLNACTFAKLGLAIWRSKPEAYSSYDQFMFETQYPPTAEQARAVADQLAGRDSIESALNDPDLENVLRTGINIFYTPAIQRKVLPILMTPERAVYGIPDPTELTAIFHH